VALAAVLGALGFVLGGWFMSGPLKDPTAFIVPDGSSLGSVAAKLEGEGAIDSAAAFRCARGCSAAALRSRRANS
jgi:UPF0755 protein